MRLSTITLLTACLALAAFCMPGLAAQPAGKVPELGVMGGAPTMAEPITGTVTDTMDSGGYTYIELEDAGRKTWVAVPKMKVKKGEQHAFMPGNVMFDFKSKTMGRSFDMIVFSPGPLVLPGTKAEKQALPDTAPTTVDKVEKASGKDARTVGECYADAAKLDKKTVSVRGRVVKVSQRIMGKNWVHIQDGTGEPAKGTHNLVFTTDDLPEVDDVVTATGTLAKDRDFGYGYKYDVIVEESHIKK